MDLATTDGASMTGEDADAQRDAPDAVDPSDAMAADARAPDGRVDDSGVDVVAPSDALDSAVTAEEISCSPTTPLYDCSSSGAAPTDQLSVALLVCEPGCVRITIDFDAIGCASKFDVSQDPSIAPCLAKWLSEHRVPCAASQSTSPHWSCTH